MSFLKVFWRFYRGGISDDLFILYDARLHKNRLLQTLNLRYILSILLT